MKDSVRNIALTLVSFPVGALNVIAQGEIGRGFPYGDDGGWSGLFNVIVVGVVLYLVIGLLWLVWEALRSLVSRITSWLK